MLVYSRNVYVLQEIWDAESISGDKFRIASRINVLTGHTQTLSSQKSPKMVLRARNDRVFIGKLVR